MLSLSSALITALIVSSDTLNFVQDVSTQQKNDIPMHEVPTECDKNIKQVISESKTETINVDSKIYSNSNPNLNGDNAAEDLNLELMQQKEQQPESEVVTESQIVAPDQQEDTDYAEDCIEIGSDDNA